MQQSQSRVAASVSSFVMWDSESQEVFPSTLKYAEEMVPQVLRAAGSGESMLWALDWAASARRVCQRETREGSGRFPSRAAGHLRVLGAARPHVRGAFPLLMAFVLAQDEVFVLSE